MQQFDHCSKLFASSFTAFVVVFRQCIQILSTHALLLLGFKDTPLI